MDLYFLDHLCFFWKLEIIINNHNTEKSLYFENRASLSMTCIQFSPSTFTGLLHGGNSLIGNLRYAYLQKSRLLTVGNSCQRASFFAKSIW